MDSLISKLIEMSSEDIDKIRDIGRKGSCPNGSCSSCILGSLSDREDCVPFIKIARESGNSIGTKQLGEGARIMVRLYEEHRAFIRF